MINFWCFATLGCSLLNHSTKGAVIIYGWGRWKSENPAQSKFAPSSTTAHYGFAPSKIIFLPLGGFQNLPPLNAYTEIFTPPLFPPPTPHK